MSPSQPVYLDRYKNLPITPEAQEVPGENYESGLELDWSGSDAFALEGESGFYEDLTQGQTGERASDEELLQDLVGGELPQADYDSDLDELEEAPDEMDIEFFLQDVKAAEKQLEEYVNSREIFSKEEKSALIEELKEKLSILKPEGGIQSATDQLHQIVETAQTTIETRAEAAQEAHDKHREELFDIITQSTQEPLFAENKGHWHHVGWSLGEQFDTALQSGDWTEFGVAVDMLTDGDQRFVPIMRLVSAIYRTAGSEAKATEIINNFIPKNIVQKLIARVTSAADALDWKGQGWPDNQDQVGPDKWHLWTPSGTADFLRGTLEARRGEDPYAPMTQSEDV